MTVYFSFFDVPGRYKSRHLQFVMVFTSLLIQIHYDAGCNFTKKTKRRVWMQDTPNKEIIQANAQHLE
jgi:hypothetical protein